MKATAAVTILNDAVQAGEEVDAAAVTVSKNGDKYIMAFADGNYFAMQHNGCLLSATSFDLDFEYTGSGVKISGYVSAKSARYVLLCNANSSPVSYRCYANKIGETGYSLPTLYKYED